MEGMEVINAVHQIFPFLISQTCCRIILSVPCGWLRHVSNSNNELGLEVNTFAGGRSYQVLSLCHCGAQCLRECLLHQPCYLSD